MISTLAAFMTKEVRHILRDRQTLTVLLLMPLVQVVLFGYALRSDVRDVRLAIVDPSPDYASLSLRERFEAPVENRTTERRDDDRDVSRGTPRDVRHGPGAASNSSKRITVSTSFAAGHG